MTTRSPQTPSATQPADPGDRPAEACALDRIRDVYVQEGMALLGEGVPAQAVEHAGLQAGMPAGPLAMLDEMSLERLDEALHRRLAHDDEQVHGHGCAHDRDPAHDHGDAHGHDSVHEHDHDHAPAHGHDHAHDHGRPHAAPGRGQAAPMPESAVYVLEKMAHGFRRLGRAAGSGFYDYLPGEPASLWPGLSSFERGAEPIDEQDVVDRLLYAPVIESLRCLQDGAAAQGEETAPDGTAGPLVRPAEVIGRIGAARFLERADALAARYGERFRAPALLRDQVSRAKPR